MVKVVLISETVVKPVVTGISVHLLSEQDVIVITVVSMLVLVDFPALSESEVDIPELGEDTD